MSFLDLLKHRRSIRQYKEEAVSKEALEAIVEAGLLSPSGRNIRPWELIVVQKKETLEKMSECRVGSAKMLAGASVAIVVIAGSRKRQTYGQRIVPLLCPTCTTWPTTWGLEAAGSRDV